MAFATARLPLSLPLSHHHHRYTKPPIKPHLSSSPTLRLLLLLRPSSLDVSKEDRSPIPSLDVSKEDRPPIPSEQEDPKEEAEAKSDKQRRLEEERFAVLNTGIYDCRSCGHRYDQAVGDPSYPIPPGFDFAKLPEDWRCPTCGAAKSFFVSKSVEIAGFAQNQQYGLGGNTLTSGQKAVLIYGSLLFFFTLFLGGYFLQ